MNNYNNDNSYKNVIENFKNYSLTIRNLTENSIKTIIETIENFLNFMNKIKFHFDSIEDINLDILRTIQNKDICFYIYDLADRGCSSNTRISRTEHLKTFFNYLFRIKHTLFKQPINDVSLEAKNHRHLPNYLNETQARAMSTLYKNSTKLHEIRTNAIINLSLNAGLRMNEIIELRISELELDENRFIVHGKGQKERTCYLNKVAKEALLKYLDMRKNIVPARKSDADYVFLSNKNKKMDDHTIRSFIKVSYNKAHIDSSKYSMHTLRHTCATLLYKAGVDIRTIQELLGHEQLDTTTIYTHIHDNSVKDSMLNHPLAHFTMKDALSYNV